MLFQSFPNLKALHLSRVPLDTLNHLVAQLKEATRLETLVLGRVYSPRKSRLELSDLPQSLQLLRCEAEGIKEIVGLKVPIVNLIGSHAVPSAYEPLLHMFTRGGKLEITGQLPVEKFNLRKVIAHNVGRFRMDPVTVCFRERGSTLVGPSGYGKTSLLSIVQDVLNDLWLAATNPIAMVDTNSGTDNAYAVLEVAVQKPLSDERRFFMGFCQVDGMSRYSFAVEADGEFLMDSRPPPLSFSSPTEVVLLVLKFCLSCRYVPQDFGARMIFSDLESSALSRRERKQFMVEDFPHIAPSLLTLHNACLAEYNSSIREKLAEIVGLDILAGTPGVVSFALTGSTDSFSFHNLSGGQYDALMSLRGLYQNYGHFHPQIVLLDEPGQNLGASERMALQALISKNRELGKQVIIATHHVEMINMTEFPKGVLRCFIQPETGGTVDEFSKTLEQLLPLDSKNHNDADGEAEYSAATQPGSLLSMAREKRLGAKQLVTALSQHEILPIIFCKKAIIVEGRSDLRILRELVQVASNKNFKLAHGVNMFHAEGCNGVVALSQLCRASGVQFLQIRDSDVLFERSADHKKLYSDSDTGEVGKMCRSYAGHCVNNVDLTKAELILQKDVVDAKIGEVLAAISSEHVEKLCATAKESLSVYLLALASHPQYGVGLPRQSLGTLPPQFFRPALPPTSLKKGEIKISEKKYIGDLYKRDLETKLKAWKGSLGEAVVHVPDLAELGLPPLPTLTEIGKMLKRQPTIGSDDWKKLVQSLKWDDLYKPFDYISHCIDCHFFTSFDGLKQNILKMVETCGCCAPPNAQEILDTTVHPLLWLCHTIEMLKKWEQNHEENQKKKKGDKSQTQSSSSTSTSQPVPKHQISDFKKFMKSNLKHSRIFFALVLFKKLGVRDFNDCLFMPVEGGSKRKFELQQSSTRDGRLSNLVWFNGLVDQYCRLLFEFSGHTDLVWPSFISDIEGLIFDKSVPDSGPSKDNRFHDGVEAWLTYSQRITLAKQIKEAKVHARDMSISDLRKQLEANWHSPQIKFALDCLVKAEVLTPPTTAN
eukprot:TRINITY_DN824_c0_g1_i3.p1 TRINITY_DN824_c0_g1~~TRINITY_DN824_c0_g1_i3.p1  ORF type:complete len:1050 (-),score=118.10 TRINITY_DN824_c0_g1_i3:1128-4277(-)